MAVNVKKCAVTGILWGQARRNGSDKVLSSKTLKMLHLVLEHVSFQPLLEQSRYISHLPHSCTPTLSPTYILE